MLGMERSPPAEDCVMPAEESMKPLVLIQRSLFALLGEPATRRQTYGL